MATALNRAPFVVVLIALLAGGIAGVLWLNTLTDEAGMRTSTAKSNATDLRLTIESLQQDVAMLDATPKIADEAAKLGMVPAGDSAMLMVDGSGQGRSSVSRPSCPVRLPALRSPAAQAPADQHLLRQPAAAAAGRRGAAAAQRSRRPPAAAGDPAAGPGTRPPRRRPAAAAAAQAPAAADAAAPVDPARRPGEPPQPQRRHAAADPAGRSSRGRYPRRRRRPAQGAQQ